jgi:hypothetical protein
MRFRSCAIATTLAVTLCAGRGQTAEPAVTITLDASRPGGQLRPAWRFFGYDEPNYTYMREGKALLADLATLGRQSVCVRTHNLLTSGDGTPALKWGSTGAYTEEAQGRPHYDWTIVDRIFDTYLERGLKPYVQIGFMPQALSQKREPYQHHWSPQGGNISTGWAYPPSDYRKWGELVYQWVTHCASRYGRSEVERWYWEVWNEPNIMHWRETAEDYPGSTTTPRTPSSGRCRPRAWAARRSPARELRRRPGSSATLSSTACAEPTTPRARSAPRSISSRPTPKARRELPTATSRWKSPPSFRTSIAGSRSSPAFPS